MVDTQVKALDPYNRGFPWRRPPLEELSKSIQCNGFDVNEKPALIALFDRSATSAAPCRTRRAEGWRRCRSARRWQRHELERAHDFLYRSLKITCCTFLVSFIHEFLSHVALRSVQ